MPLSVTDYVVYESSAETEGPPCRAQRRAEVSDKEARQPLEGMADTKQEAGRIAVPELQDIGWCVTRRPWLLTAWGCGAAGSCERPVVEEQRRLYVCVPCVLHRVWQTCGACIVPELCSVRVSDDHRPYVDVVCDHPVRCADLSDHLFGARRSQRYADTLRRVRTNGLHLVARSLRPEHCS